MDIHKRTRISAATLRLRLGVAVVCSCVLSAAALAGDPLSAQQGEWSAVEDWPVLAVHAALLENGKVLAWDATPDDFDDNPHTTEVYTTRITLWDPATGQHSSVNNNTNTDLFCAGAAHLWDGDLLLAGGDGYRGGAPGTAAGAVVNSNVFNPQNNAWTALEDMASARWYSTVAALPNGEMLTFGGNYGQEPFAEVLGLDRRWRSLPIDAQMPYAYSGDYQWLQVTPNGLVASFGPHNTLGLLDTGGTGRWRTLSNTRDTVPYRGYGSFAPYQTGKILVTGGVGYYGEGPRSERSAVVLDLNTMRATATSDMLYSRSQHNLTVLPDGKVLAIGGHSSAAALIDLTAPVLPSEMWDPATGEWREMAALARTRQYHSTSLLLPDGRVLVAGGGYCGPCTVLDYHEQNAEIYSPPYLFDPRGELAARPLVSGVPQRLNYGEAFAVTVQSTSAISKAVFIKPGSTTHSHNQDQRLIELTLEPTAEGVRLIAPQNRNLAPPGHYLLFLLDENGVPSLADTVLIGQPSVRPSQAVAQSVLSGDLDIYAVESYVGDSVLRVSLDGIHGDADLYLRRDLYPDGLATGSFECGSAHFGGTAESCTVNDPGRATWYVAVRAWSGGAYRLNVSAYADESQTNGEIEPAKRDSVQPVDDGSAFSGGGGVGMGVPLLLLALIAGRRRRFRIGPAHRQRS